MKRLRATVAFAALVVLLILGSPHVISHGEPHTSVNPPPPSPMQTAFDSVRTDLGDYLWPTDASMKVTSAFAEYRTTHFHGGIDIGTNGRTGYKVFAARDGYVYRVRIAANGYGKMLYVRHHDGYFTTYSHLLTFNDTINANVRREQYRTGTFSTDYYPDTNALRVKKGEVIAYTGESGFGPPHLHFEIRDENLNPLNPMLCESYSVRDRIAPAIRRVLISPLNYTSTIDNSTRGKIFSRFPRRKGTYRIPQTLRVHGLIGFGIEAADRVDGSYSKEGIHRLELYLDDSLAYAMQLDRVPAEETKQIDLHYDFPTILRGWGKFQKLYIDSGNTLPFYDKLRTGAGMVNTDRLTEGEHTYRIVCRDISGNETQLVGKMLANHQPGIAIERIDNDGIMLTGRNLERVEKCFVYGKKNSDHDWSQQFFTRKQMEQMGDRMKLPPLRRQYDVIKVVAESKWGSRSAPLFHFFRKPEGSAREMHLDTDVENDRVVFTVSSTGAFTSAPSLTVQEGEVSRAVDLEPVDLFKYAGTFRPLNTFMGNRMVRVTGEVNGHPASADDVFELYPLAADKANRASLFNRQVVISYDSGASYRTVYMAARMEFIRNSPVYVFEPDDALLDRGLRVTVDAGNDATSDHLGLYFRSNGGWIFQTATCDSGRTTFSTTLTRTLGELALLKDAQPPSFGRLRLSARRGRAYVAFRYNDDLSGVDTDEIKMYIDDHLIIPEIDGEHRKVAYQATEPLARGRHTLRIVMKDRMKNSAEINRVFSVK